jgi:hypothetical protein
MSAAEYATQDHNTEVAAEVPRPRRVIRGDGMVTVRQPASWRGERLEPGKSRFSPDHPLVHQQPELFEACYNRDRAVLLCLKRMLERRLEEAGAGGRESWRLPDTAEERPWELR